MLKELQKIARRHGDKLLPVVMLTERGEAELLPLQALLARGQSALAFRTIVLPVEAGGLHRQGLLDGAVKEPAIGVAEAGGKRVRVVFRRDGDIYWHSPIGDYKAGEIESNNFDNGQISAR